MVDDEDPDLLDNSRLWVRLVALLDAYGIKRLSELSILTDGQILMIPGVGKDALAAIRHEIGRQVANGIYTIH